MLTLNEADYLGKGGTKIVYRHPLDPGLCIKFPNPRKKRAKVDLKREIKYLKKHQDKLPFLAKYLGEIKCDRGTGFIYQFALNEDSSPSKPITEFLKTKKPADLKRKVEEIYFALIKQHALISDTQLSNVFIIEKRSGEYDFCFVDGFGNSDFIKICDYSKYFLIKKLNRKFTKLCSRLNIENDFLI